MAETANVRAIESIRDFRSAVIQFQEATAQSLAGIYQQLQRAGEWVEHDRPLFWKQEVKRGFERVAEARAALSACQMRRHGDFKPSCYEEREALRAAQRRLQIAQEKIEIVRLASARLRHEVDEYRGRATQLESVLVADIPRIIALLERIAGILDNYAGVIRQPTANVTGDSGQTGDSNQTGDNGRGHGRIEADPPSQSVASTNPSAKSDHSTSPESSPSDRRFNDTESESAGEHDAQDR